MWRGGAKCDSSRSDSLTAGCSALSALCAPIKLFPEENFGRKCIQGINPWSAELYIIYIEAVKVLNETHDWTTFLNEESS